MNYYLNNDERLGGKWLISETNKSMQINPDEPITVAEAFESGEYKIEKFSSVIGLMRYILSEERDPKKTWNILKQEL